MLTAFLFRGTDKLHEKLAAHVPQHSEAPRRLLSLVVIHEAGISPGVEDPKIMLYQEVDDSDHFWIRKETPSGENGRTNFSETECEDAISALGGFERATQLMLDNLLNSDEAPELARSGAT